MNKTALLLCDDAEEGGTWASLLRGAGLEVISTGARVEDLEALEHRGVDLIVINSHDHRMDNLALCQRLRSEFINPILLLAPLCDDEQVIKAYDAGVDDYVQAPVAPDLFLAKVQAWLRHAWRATASGLEDIRVGPFSLDACRRELNIEGRPPVKLTNLEFRVLHLLMSHPGRLLETNMIVDRVWGYAGHDESVLLKNVIYRLRRKIEADPARPRYIQTVNGAGYTFRNN